MAIVRYDPWRMLNELQREMNKVFEGRLSADENTSDVVTADWAPAVDVKEEKDRFVLLADVPGVDPKEIEVHMEKGVLTIKGARNHETEKDREAYKRIERPRGSFYRRFSLPDTADAERISAKSLNGVLEITIPKMEATKPRKITVEG
jgi:HSP20 family protein